MYCPHGNFGTMFRCPHGCNRLPEDDERNERAFTYFLKRLVARQEERNKVRKEPE